jgi:hypothetical protein
VSEPIKAFGGDATNATGRSHTCCRCERIADEQRRNGYPAAVPSQAHSWVAMGMRYWSALCVACGRWERDQREMARVRAGKDRVA